jgi:hypothetical protein
MNASIISVAETTPVTAMPFFLCSDVLTAEEKELHDLQQARRNSLASVITDVSDCAKHHRYSMEEEEHRVAVARRASIASKQVRCPSFLPVDYNDTA